MIEFLKINQKGDRLRAFTHRNYLSKHYNQTIAAIQCRNKTWANVACYSTTILTYFALNKIPVLNNIVQNKLSFKGRFFVVSALVGFIDSLLFSVILNKSLNNTREKLLSNQIFPGWYKQQRVINPDRVYFQLDDNRDNQPNIWHSGITHQGIQNLIPDFVVGNVTKPHYPVAQHHHH